jgi:hypothetical protein
LFSRDLFAVFGCLVLLPSAFAQSSSTVGIFLDFEVRPAPEVVASMQREITELIRPSGLNPLFLYAKTSQEWYKELVVVTFKGKCSVDRWRSEEQTPSRKPVALATTLVDNGRVLPFSKVRCDQLRRGLGTLEPRAGRKQQQAALGLAMGRVVAHELYHVLARTTTHAVQGLAKGTHDLAELVSGVVAFGEEDLSRMAAK